MNRDFEPALDPVKIAELRPTQMTVGFKEVARKRTEWRERGQQGAEYLGRHLIPVVRGPRKRLYIIDHHHMVLALHEEGVEHVLTNLVADLDGLEKSAFWTFLDNRNWLHLFDASGRRCDYDKLPKTITALTDDPYRSLAGELRRAGGYAKVETPYSEFLWADFLRRKIDRKTVEADFPKAVAKALVLAHGQAASYLPGWCGPAKD